MRIVSVITFFIIYSFRGFSQENANPSSTNPLLGAWEMQSVSWITADTAYTIAKTQPGLFLFTPERYGIMWSPSREPRVPFENLSNPSQEEIIAGFRSVVFNGGTYESTDTSLITTALIAKVPGFESGKQIYRYHITDDQLILTMYDETYPDGSKPEWYGTYETEFTLKKAH